MIYDRHEDLVGDDEAPPGDRPPPDGRQARRDARRPGHRRRHGRRRVLHAHAGRPVAAARSTPAARTAARTSGSAPARPARTRRRTARSAASGRRSPSSRRRCRSNRLAEALGISPLEIRRRNVYRVGDTTPTGQVLRESVAGVGGPRARRRGGRVRARPGPHHRRAGATRRLRGRGGHVVEHDRPDRTASGIGLALAWHGAGFTGSGEVKLASVASVELGADGADPDPDRLDGDGPGHEDDLPAARRGGAGRRVRRRRDRAAGHLDRARLRADRRLAERRWSSAGLLIKAARRLRAQVEERNDGRRSRRPTATTPRPTARPASTSSSSPTRASTSTTRRTTATPTRRSAGRPASRRSTSTSTAARSRSATSSRPTTSARSSTRSSREGQVEGGTLQAVGYATIEEIKLRDGRYLNDRLATYIIPTSLDAPRITSILVEAPFSVGAARREGRRRAADGRRGAGGRRRDPRRDRRLGPRPAGDAGADPRGAGRDAADRGAGRLARAA